MGRFLRLARYSRAMQGRLIGFDGLRGIAALSVLLLDLSVMLGRSLAQTDSLARSLTE